MNGTRKLSGNRKEELAGLAADLMQTQGFSALALRDLAQKACIQAASLYSHFNSKNSLAQQAMALYTLRQSQDLSEIDKELSGNVKLYRYVDMFATTLNNENRLCLGLMLAAERNAIPVEVTQELRSFAKQNVDWLQATWDCGCVDKTIISNMEGRIAAPMIFGAAEGIMAFSLLDKNPAAALRLQLGGLLAALGVQPSDTHRKKRGSAKSGIRP